MQNYFLACDNFELPGLANLRMNKMVRPIHAGPQLLAHSSLWFSAEFCVDPCAGARLCLFNGPFARREPTSRSGFWKLRNKTNRSETDLDFDMPANYASVVLRFDRQQIHFIDTMLHAANCEESFAIQPLFNQTFPEQCHVAVLSARGDL